MLTMDGGSCSRPHSLLDLRRLCANLARLCRFFCCNTRDLAASKRCFASASLPPLQPEAGIQGSGFWTAAWWCHNCGGRMAAV